MTAPFDLEALEAARALRDARAYCARHRDAINAEWDALPDGRVPPLTAEETTRAELEWRICDRRD